MNIGFNTYSQTSSFDSLQSVIQIKHNIYLDTLSLCEFYLLDGKPLEKKELTQILEKANHGIKATKLLDASSSDFLDKNCDYLISLSTSKSQSKKEKKQLFTTIKENLENALATKKHWDYNCHICQVMSIDGVVIKSQEAIKIIRHLKSLGT